MKLNVQRLDFYAGRFWMVVPLFLLGAYVSNIPLFALNVLFCSEDLLAYYLWTQDFTDAVLEGVWRPRWSASGMEGLGAPAFLYVSPAFSYVATIFRALGADVWLSMRLTIFVVIWALGLSVWYGLKRFVPSRWALVGGLCSQFNPILFHAVNLHNLFPFYCAVLPLVWLLFASVDAPRLGLRPKVVFSVAILVLTHQLVAFMALLSLPFLFLPRLIRRESGAWNASLWWGGSVALGLMVSAYYLFPALTSLHLLKLENWFERFHVDWRNSFIVPVVTYFIYGMRWAGVQWGLGGLAALSVLVIIWGAWISKGKTETQSRLLTGGVCAGGAATFLASEYSYFLWDAIPVLRMIGWPYRFLVVILPICIVTLIPVAVPHRSRVLRGVAVVVLCLYPVLSVIVQVRNVSVSESPEFESMEAIKLYMRPAEIGDQWLSYLEQGGLGAECERMGVGLDADRSTSHNFKWTLTAERGGLTVRIPLLAFPAWIVSIDGEPIVPSTDEDTGLITVPLQSGRNEVTVRWGKLNQEVVGSAISVLAVLMVACCCGYSRLSQRRDA